MDSVELLSARKRLLDELFSATHEIENRGKTLAEAERLYRVALAKRTLELKQAGYPVTVITDITRGDENVASLRFDRDVAREMLKAIYERINVMKWQLKVVQDSIKMEYNSYEN